MKDENSRKMQQLCDVEIKYLVTLLELKVKFLGSSLDTIASQLLDLAEIPVKVGHLGDSYSTVTEAPREARSASPTPVLPALSLVLMGSQMLPVILAIQTHKDYSFLLAQKKIPLRFIQVRKYLWVRTHLGNIMSFQDIAIISNIQL